MEMIDFSFCNFISFPIYSWRKIFCANITIPTLILIFFRPFLISITAQRIHIYKCSPFTIVLDMPSMVESSCATERSAILIRFRYIFLFDSLCEIISYANTDSILAHIYKRSLVSAHMVMRYENKIKRPPLKRCIPSGSIAHTRYIFDTYLCIRCDSMAILKIYSA